MEKVMRWLKLCIGLSALLFLGKPVLAQTLIVIDSTNTGEITSTSSVVIFSFEADSGQELSIELSAVTQGFAVQAVVLNSDNGLVLALGNPNNLTRISSELTIPTAGVYTIQVTSSNSRTGEFVLRLSTTSDDELCEAYVIETLEEIQDVCEATGRNQACVGNLDVSATPIANLSADYPFNFEQVGDIVDIATVETFELSPLDTVNNQWGVAFLLVQADIPDTLPGQNVSMLLLGDVEVTNTAITNPDLLLDYRPMQAFYFSTGIGEQRCSAVPDTGILIETPEADVQISFSINEVVVQLGSTAFFSLSDHQTLDIDLLEGSALVSAENQTQLMTSGQRISVPVDENLLASAPPNPAIPIPEDAPRFPLPTSSEPNEPNTPVSTDERPELPTSGQCVLRSFEEEGNPNVRSGPSTEFSVTSFIVPTELYPVIGRTEDNTWFEISTGWIAAFVTERGGDCANIPVTYIPPTPTPVPTATPSLPVAGSNNYSITIDAEVLGLQHSLSGNISSPVGVNQDFVTYSVVNSQSEMAGSALSYSISCTGIGVEHALIIFSDGQVRPCSATASNFVDMGFNTIAETITIAFDSSVDEAYVTWSMSFSVQR